MLAHEILLERDVVNASDDVGDFYSIKVFTDALAERETNPLVQRFITGPFWRWIINDYNDPSGTVDLSARRDPSFHRNLPDWAAEKLRRGTRLWLVDPHALTDVAIEMIDYVRSLDDKRHIFHTPVDELLRQARRWHADLADQEVTAERVHLPTVMGFPDGYRWVELTPDACQREGQIMQNCIAQSDYAGLIREGDIHLFSLRDPQDDPHVTISSTGSLSSLYIDQIKGKQNKPPVEKYHRYIEKFLNDHDAEFDLTGTDDLHAMQMIEDSGRVVDKKRLSRRRLAVAIFRYGSGGKDVPQSKQSVTVAQLESYLVRHGHYIPEELYFSLAEHGKWDDNVDVGDKTFHLVATFEPVEEGKKKKPRPFTVGWLLPPAERQKLLDRFPPIYPDVIAHHVTLSYGVGADHPPPTETAGTVVGVADDEQGVQALVMEIGGTTKRPDGETYHVTWSINRSQGRMPKDAKAAVKRFTTVEPISIALEPAIF